jgi:hypothetical protein
MHTSAVRAAVATLLVLLLGAPSAAQAAPSVAGESGVDPSSAVTVAEDEVTTLDQPAAGRRVESTTVVVEGQRLVLDATDVVTAGMLGLQWQQWQAQYGNEPAQWRNLDGATGPTLLVSEATPLHYDGMQFRLLRLGLEVAGPTVVRVTPAVPVVVQHPGDLTVNVGAIAVYSASYRSGVSNGGTDADTRQTWEVSSNGGATWEAARGVSLLGTFTILGVTAEMHGWRFRARFTNDGGSAVTNAANLFVRGLEPVGSPPVVTTQPVGWSLYEGNSWSFTAGASSPDGSALSVQWYSRTGAQGEPVAVSGGTSSTLAGTATLAQNGWEYAAAFTNQHGTVWTSWASLVVSPVAPRPTTHPESQTVLVGESVTFVGGYGNTEAVPELDWLRRCAGGGWEVVGSGLELTIDAATLEMNGCEFRLRFTLGQFSSWTDPATLTVLAPPVITSEPADVTVGEWQTLRFEAGASSPDGSEMSVQWYFRAGADGQVTALDGETSATLELSARWALHGHQFAAAFTNGAGAQHTVWTRWATASVRAADPVPGPHPGDQRVMVGQSATFRGGYSGTESDVLARWMVSTVGGGSGAWSFYEGAEGSELTVENVTLEMSGWMFRLHFQVGERTWWTDPATLTVLAPPVVTSSPVDLVRYEGNAWSFAAGASSPDGSELSVQWYSRAGADGEVTAVDGATSSTLSGTSRWALNGHQYAAAFTNGAGAEHTVWSRWATLTVSAVAPVPGPHPQDQTVVVGESVSFRGGYSGTDSPVQARWQVSRDGGQTWELEGTEGLELTFAAVRLDMDGWRFRLRFDNGTEPNSWSRWSDPATLTVIAPRPVHVRVVPRVELVDTRPRT